MILDLSLRLSSILHLSDGIDLPAALYRIEMWYTGPWLLRMLSSRPGKVIRLSRSRDGKSRGSAHLQNVPKVQERLRMWLGPLQRYAQCHRVHGEFARSGLAYR